MSSNPIRLALTRDSLKLIFGMWTPYQQNDVCKLIFTRNWFCHYHHPSNDVFSFIIRTRFFGYFQISRTSDSVWVTDFVNFRLRKEISWSIEKKNASTTNSNRKKNLFMGNFFLAINIKERHYKQSSRVYIFEHFPVCWIPFKL